MNLPRGYKLLRRVLLICWRCGHWIILPDRLCKTATPMHRRCRSAR